MAFGYRRGQPSQRLCGIASGNHAGVTSGNWSRATSGSWSRATSGLLSLPALLLLSRPAIAAEPAPLLTAHLEYERAPGAEVCPDERSVKAALTAQLGATALDPPAAEPSPRFDVRHAAPADIDVRQSLPRIRLKVGARPGKQREIAGHIELEDRGGKVVWSNDLFAAHGDCATLIASLALSLRIAADGFARPSANAGVSPRASSVEPVQQPIVIKGRPIHPPNIPATATLPPSWGPPPDSSDFDFPLQPVFTFWVNSAVSAGSAPREQVRLALGSGFAWPFFSVSVEARGFLPASGQFRGHVLEVARWEGAILPCMSRSFFLVCGILSVGGLHGDVSGVHQDTVVSLHATGGGRFVFLWPILSELALAIHTDVEASLEPAVIRMDDFDVWTEPIGQVAVGIALTGAFPGMQQ